jgi:excisionase family DNA binding protein
MVQNSRNAAQGGGTIKKNRRPPGVSPAFFGGLFLGVCILIAGFNVGGGIKKLNDTIAESLTVTTEAVAPEPDISGKKYLSETEAALYLGVPVQKVLELIDDKEITEYVKTDGGYSISVKTLDEWFDNAAYQTKLKIIGLPPAD